MIAELCLYYGIGDGELWSRTLEKLYDLAMVCNMHALTFACGVRHVIAS